MTRRLIAVAFWLALAVFAPVWAGAQAQETEADSAPVALTEQGDWLRLIARAEDLAGRDDASSFAITRLRAELVSWRDVFLDQTDVNAARLATVDAQLAALGPVPESGEEPAAIADRRAALTAQRAQLSVPRVLAAEAFARADGVIGEFDALLLQRQTDALTERSDSPLATENLRGAVATAVAYVDVLIAETTAGFSAQWQSGRLGGQMPRVIALLLLALALLGPVRIRLTQALVTWRPEVRSLRPLVPFFLSLLQITAPLLGLFALTEALQALGVAGLRGGMVVEAIPLSGFVIVGGWWLAQQIFRVDLATPEAAPEAARGRQLVIGLAWVAGIGVLFDASLRTMDVSAVVLASLEWPVLAVLSVLLWFLGKVIRNKANALRDAQPTQARFIQLAGQAAAVVAVVSPLGTALGYLGVGRAVLVPSLQSLALLALIVLLQDLFRKLTSGWVRDEDQKGLPALLPVLSSFTLVALSLPLFALIWGAEAAGLWEMWERFKDGFVIGQTRFSPADVVTFAVVFAVGYVVTRAVQGALRKSVLPRTRLDLGGQNAIVAGLGYVGIILAAIVAITMAGIDLSNLAIVAGALSVGIGFGLQNIVSNFVSGIILLIERPISEGDWIEVGGKMGYVRAISVRSTRIETFDRTDLIIPNADLVSGQVTNWTRGNLVGRVIVPVGVAYGSDLEKVTQILQQIAEEHPIVMTTPPPSVVFKGFGADSLDFEIRAILRDVNYVLQTHSEMNYAIAKRFAEEGIEIPFAQRDIWIRNPEALKGDA